jgi:hypothetical protein
MINVIISYPSGEREEVILSGVPRVGESIRLRTTKPDSPSLVVEAVLWQEGGMGNGPEPRVIVAVRPRPNGPR